MAKGKQSDEDIKDQTEETAEPSEKDEDAGTEEFADNGDDAESTENEDAALDGSSNEGADDDEHVEAADSDDKAAPEAKAETKDDWESRRASVWDRAEKWMQPGEQRTDASQTTTQAAATDKKSDEPAEFKLSPEDEAYIANVRKEFGDADADKLVKPLMERAAKAEQRAARVEAEQNKLAAERKAQDEKAQAEQYTAMMNAAGKEIAAVAGKGYESVLGKIGRYDPVSKSFAGSTADQNKTIGRFYSAANFYFTQAQNAGDPITERDALKMALEHMEAKDPAFKPIREAKALAAKRGKQTTIPPARGRAAANANSKGTGSEAAVNALRQWREKNPIEEEVGV